MLSDTLFGALGLDKTIGVILPTVLPAFDCCSSNIHGKEIGIKKATCQPIYIFYGTTKLFQKLNSCSSVVLVFQNYKLMGFRGV